MVAEPRVLGLTAARSRGIRHAVALGARRLAFLAFAVAVLTSPLRAAATLVAQPIASLYAGYTDFSLSGGELAAIAALVLWSVSLVAEPRTITLGPRSLWLPAVGLLALAWASIGWSLEPVISAQHAATMTILAVFALYVVNEVPLGRATSVVGGMVVLQAVVAIAQVVGQRSLGLSWLGELSLSPVVNGISVVATSAADRLLRGYGLTDHPNILGGVLAFALPLLAFELARGRGARLSAAAAAVALGSAALLLTFSRSAWLAAAVALAVELAMLARRRAWARARRLALVFAAAGLLCVLLALPYARYVLVRADVAGQGVATEQMSTGERAILIEAAARLVATRPLTGTGLATAPMAVHAANPDLGFDAQPSPVVLLDVAVELGLLGALCYAAILAAPWVTLTRRSVRWTPELIAASASLAALVVVGLFDYYTWTFAAGRIWAWLLLGLWAGAFLRATASDAAPAPGTVHG